jgi:hypothetical protein
MHACEWRVHRACSIEYEKFIVQVKGHIPFYVRPRDIMRFAE